MATRNAIASRKATVRASNVRRTEERNHTIEWGAKTARAAVLTAIQCLDGRGAVDTALADTLRAAALENLDKVLEAVRS